MTALPARDAVTGVLLAADLDVTRTPDGLYTLRREDGSRLVFGEDSAGDWWDYTIYGRDDEIQRTDGEATLADLIPVLQQWKGTE